MYLSKVSPSHYEKPLGMEERGFSEYPLEILSIMKGRWHPPSLPPRIYQERFWQKHESCLLLISSQARPCPLFMFFSASGESSSLSIRLALPRPCFLQVSKKPTSSSIFDLCSWDVVLYACSPCTPTTPFAIHEYAACFQAALGHSPDDLADNTLMYKHRSQNFHSR